MSSDQADILSALLARRLGTADAAERAAAEAALASSDEARRRDRAIERLLQPLSRFEVTTPHGLEDRILAGLHAPRTLKFPARPAADTPAALGGSRFRMSDLLSLAAAILLIVGVFAPGYQAARMTAQRNACMQGMRDVGEATHQYAMANLGAMPYATAPSRGEIRQDGTKPLPAIPNLIRVLSTQGYLPQGRSPVCPTDAPGTDRGLSGQIFLRPMNLDALSPQLPIAADANPFVRNNVLRADQSPRNSDAHGLNAGQNVLRLDGSIHWWRRPTVGIENDNIFRIDNPSEYNSRQPLKAISDALLVP